MSGYQDTRKNVRDNVVSLLKGGITSVADASISSFRVQSMFNAELSAINVYTGEDTSILNKQFDWDFDRTLDLSIEIMVKRNSDTPKPEDEADTIAGKIEDRLLPNQYLQDPPPENIQVAGVDSGDPGSEIIDAIQLNSIGEAKVPEGLEDVFALVMNFTLTYHYEILAGAVVPFETADVRYNLEGEQAEADEMHDQFELPQI